MEPVHEREMLLGPKMRRGRRKARGMEHAGEPAVTPIAQHTREAVDGWDAVDRRIRSGGADQGDRDWLIE